MKRLPVVLLIMVSPFYADAFAAQTNERAPGQSPHKRITRPCEACHVSTSFSIIGFNHDDTEFPLEGKHESVACLQCHNIEDFSLVQSSCVSCHEDVHLNRLGTDCERCHSPLGWASVKGDDIHARTDFPLLGRHVLLDCEACHGGQAPTEFADTPDQCIDCHRSDYLATTNPAHASLGFSTLCTDCHQLTGWEPALMPDHDPIFPIFSGTHRGQWTACAICHTDAGNPSVFTCLACHEHAQELMDPAHFGMTGYSYTSTACYGCHPTGIAGPFLDHDAQFFPIYSGTHNRVWAECAECHPNAQNARQFTCLSCHEHAQSLMDPVHVGMSGYSYTSTACLGCHPTGEAGEFLNHDAQFFPIYSGTHNRRWDSCADCHPNAQNRSQITCLSCHEHSQSRMDSEHGGVNGYAYATTACLNCHPDGRRGN